MRQQGEEIFAAAEIDQNGIAPGAGVPATAVAAVRMNGQDSGAPT
jgi:hypothetical protein